MVNSSCTRNYLIFRSMLLKLITFSLFTILSITGNSQINIINESLTDSSKNIFYIGVDNRVRITGFPDNCRLAITGGGGTLQTSGNDHQYIVRVSTPIDDCQLILLKGTKNIFRKSYLIRTIGDPVATLSGIKDTTVNRNRILFNPFLSIVIPNCYVQLNYQVISFTATFINGSDSILTIANGNLLSKEQVSLVKEVDAVSKIYFDNIRAYRPDGRTRKIPPFWIKIQ